MKPKLEAPNDEQLHRVLSIARTGRHIWSQFCTGEGRKDWILWAEQRAYIRRDPSWHTNPGPDIWHGFSACVMAPHFKITPSGNLKLMELRHALKAAA